MGYIVRVNTTFAKECKIWKNTNIPTQFTLSKNKIAIRKDNQYTYNQLKRCGWAETFQSVDWNYWLISSLVQIGGSSLINFHHTVQQFHIFKLSHFANYIYILNFNQQLWNIIKVASSKNIFMAYFSLFN